jgi:hypothetical protein
MTVAAVAVATTTVAGLTSGGNCGNHGVREVDSPKGGMVLHLQASGSSVGRDVVDKPTEEGAQEVEGGDCHHCCGFDGGCCGLPSPL